MILNGTQVVNITVTNDTSSNLHVLLYQQKIDNLTVENYKIGAWQQTYLAAGSMATAQLPIDLEVCAAEDIGATSVTTKKLPASSGDTFEMQTVDNCLQLAQSGNPSTDGSINIKNNCSKYEWVKLYKDGKPLYAAMLRPKFSQSIAVHPILGMAIATNEISTDFFDATQLSQTRELSIENQSYANFILKEDVGTGLITIIANNSKPV